MLHILIEWLSVGCWSYLFVIPYLEAVWFPSRLLFSIDMEVHCLFCLLAIVFGIQCFVDVLCSPLLTIFTIGVALSLYMDSQYMCLCVTMTSSVH